MTMFAAYCPVWNPRDISSAWNQHWRFFSSHRGLANPNPSVLFATDLLGVLSSKLALGDSVILGLDHNEDVRTGILAGKLQELGLTDAILDMHSSLSLPATFAQNTSHTPIDSIWVSADVMALRSGYCPFDDNVGMKSDHGLLLIEVCNNSILGKRLPAAVSVPARRV